MGHKTHHHHHRPKAIRLQRPPPKIITIEMIKDKKAKYAYIHTYICNMKKKFINTDLNKIDKQSQIT